MKHNITVEKLKELKACEEGIEQFEKINGEITKLKPEFYLWGCEYFSEYIEKDYFNFCVQKEPFAAIVFIPTLLSDTQIDYCVRQKPREALMFAIGQLTKEQIEYCKQNS